MAYNASCTIPLVGVEACPAIPLLSGQLDPEVLAKLRVEFIPPSTQQQQQQQQRCGGGIDTCGNAALLLQGEEGAGIPPPPEKNEGSLPPRCSGEAESAPQLLGSVGFVRCDGRGYPEEHVDYERYVHTSAKGKLSAAIDDVGGDDDVKTEEDNEMKTPTLPSVVNRLPSVVESMHPRFGHDMPKPSAGPFTMAFFAAFRRLNQQWLDELVAGLHAACGDDAGALKDIFTVDRIFADVVCQFHFGAEVPISRDKLLGWHLDPPNSLVHLAISLAGTRTLHCNPEGGGSAYTVMSQTAGDFYITSPYAYLHAVQFPSASFEAPVVSLQCRLLLTQEEMRMLRGSSGGGGGVAASPKFHDDSVSAVATTLMRVAASIAGEGACLLKMPSLKEI